MGVSTDAILAYGYNLGGGDAGWEADGIEDVYDESGDVAEALSAKLAERFGVKVSGSGYVDDDELFEKSGVTMVTYQHDSYPAYLLAAKYYQVSRGSALAIHDFTPPAGADEKLLAAEKALGILPNHEPSWWLVSFSDY